MISSGRNLTCFLHLSFFTRSGITFINATSPCLVWKQPRPCLKQCLSKKFPFVSLKGILSHLYHRLSDKPPWTVQSIQIVMEHGAWSMDEFDFTALLVCGALENFFGSRISELNFDELSRARFRSAFPCLHRNYVYMNGPYIFLCQIWGLFRQGFMQEHVIKPNGRLSLLCLQVVRSQAER